MIIDLCKLNFGQVKYKATNFQTKFSITYVNFFPSLQDLCYVFFYFYKDFNNLVTTKRFFRKANLLHVCLEKYMTIFFLLVLPVSRGSDNLLRIVILWFTFVEPF